MTKALIGHSGFVGSTLLRQAGFDKCYRSTDIADIHGQQFSTVVCAGAPAQKWIANQNPEADYKTIDELIGHIDKVQTDAFVLISTVDVFKQPVAVDEESTVDEISLHAYGLNRRRLEKFVLERFSRPLVIRLPGLVGPGLRKNVIFDLLNNNGLEKVESRGQFQFYPMVNLWFDIQTAVEHRIRLLHLTAAPMTVEELAADGFNTSFQNHLEAIPAVYDMRTRYAGLFGGAGNYQYTRRETVQAIRAYAQSEPAASKD